MRSQSQPRGLWIIEDKPGFTSSRLGHGCDHNLNPETDRLCCEFSHNEPFMQRIKIMIQLVYNITELEGRQTIHRRLHLVQTPPDSSLSSSLTLISAPSSMAPG
ncbi:hypothetical protein RRG08_028905 [Elysia crispata]|uniref:Uncharacterized protein n=1 Tax=Elysia crispata TaxID=231223 RepID=A0AAE1AS52_9GAST|nr:hypothetical protein RRG08_028905 [Elysia crispata]